MDSIMLKSDDFAIISDLGYRIANIKSSLEKDNKTILYSNISSARDAFLLIRKFEHDKKVLERQRASMK